MLTKSDFLSYLDSPMHLWAKAHNKLDPTEQSAFLDHLFSEGYTVEPLAKKYLEEVVMPTFTNAKLSWQHEYIDGDFSARSDAIVYDQAADTYHIFEIKSGTKVKPENLYDATFQLLTCLPNIPIQTVNILHLNPKYIRRGELDIKNLFTVDDVTEKVIGLKGEVASKRIEAYRVMNLESSESIDPCLSPKRCPCMDLCFPGLPDYSIFELIGVTEGIKRHLLADGVWEIASIPDNFIVGPYQYRHIQAVKSGKPVINYEVIKQELDSLIYPLYFLDYETYNSALPLYDEYHPQQQMVFQYSLHKLSGPGGELEHFEFLCLSQDDPGRKTAESLINAIGDTGSVIVWNKVFEMGRNKEMAVMYPDLADRLNNINSRVYDLMEIFKKTHYIHQDFHGSWSIKNVLPVLVPELSYHDMEINKGDKAMQAWWDLVHGSESNGEYMRKSQSTTAINLLKYCKLDTLAMVEIWKQLSNRC